MARFIIKEPDLLATANWSRSRPHIKVVPTRFSLLRIWNGALECWSISRQEPEMISLQGEGSHLSLCKKKQRKLKEGNEAKTHSYQTCNNKKEENERRASFLFPDGLPVPDSCSSGDMALPFLLKSEAGECSLLT